MPKERAYSADATVKACREAAYGVAPLTGYRSLDFKSTDLSSAQPLGDDPLLGRGRNAQTLQAEAGCRWRPDAVVSGFGQARRHLPIE